MYLENVFNIWYIYIVLLQNITKLEINMTMNRDAIIEKLNDLKSKGYIVPSENMIKTNEEIEKIK